MTSLDIWLKIMDWSHLHTFHITQHDQRTIQKLGKAGVILTGLKDLKIGGISSRYGIQGYEFEDHEIILIS